jgi:hypothetical protein
MVRFPLKGVAGVCALGMTLACASSQPVGVTKSSDLVAGCEKVGEVSADRYTRDDDVVRVLSESARSKGANMVLLTADGARSGAAYRCATPPVAGGGR